MVYVNEKFYDFNLGTEILSFRKNDPYNSTRSYYFSKDHVIKFYKYQDELAKFNESCMKRLNIFRKKIPKNFNSFKILDTENNSKFGLVVMERVQGELLIDLLKNNINIDEVEIIKSS